MVGFLSRLRFTIRDLLWLTALAVGDACDGIEDLARMVGDNEGACSSSAAVPVAATIERATS